MTDLPKLFADLAADARNLDPAALRSTILATVDDGLRAACYDGVGGPSAERSSHPERQTLTDRRDPSWDDLRRLDELEASYVTAVYEIATRSHSGPFPTDWRSATIGHRRLVALDAITILENTGQRPARWVHRAGDSLHDIELLARRHMARHADDYEKAWTSGLADEECCRLCLTHVQLRVESKAKGLCQMHLRLFNDADGIDPPPWLTEEFRRIGSPSGPAWKAARSRWLQSEGVMDRSA